ncbi:MAG: MarP family serine protease [Actinobacteria bacterium]|nr:MarP family serine protease [Actinomycetota bacterium]
MNLLDLFIGLALLSALVGGYRLGFVARVASWIGAIGGFLLGLRLAPLALRRFGELPALGKLFLTLAVLLLVAALGGALGEAVGSKLRRAVPPGPARIFDHTGGALVGVAGTLFSLWLLLPVVADVPGATAQLARNSVILSVLQDAAPRPPDFAQTVRALVGNARIPDVFDDLRPAPDIGPPPSQVPVPPEVVRRSVASTVNVESEGCGGLHEGSGFTVAPNTVVTNAHVVAGGENIRVRRPDGRLLRARAVVFDDNRDLAVLEVPGLGLSPLPIASASEGTQGAVLGYPGGQNRVRVAPAVIRDQITATGRDVYSRDRTRRQVLVLAASLRPGDSGAALIDPNGRVVGVTFAIAPDRSATAYAVDDTELRAVLGAPRRAGVGPCI